MQNVNNFCCLVLYALMPMLCKVKTGKQWAWEQEMKVIQSKIEVLIAMFMPSENQP